MLSKIVVAGGHVGALPLHVERARDRGLKGCGKSVKLMVEATDSWESKWVSAIFFIKCKGKQAIENQGFWQ